MKQVDSGHYDFSSYDSKKRFVSYWHQIKEILELKPESVLEVGIGNKTVTTQLRKSGINVITLDVDKELSPMIVGDVRKIPIKSNEFDVVGCFEVLEHLPFKHFLPSLSELKRVSKSHIILSLPDKKQCLRFKFGLKFFEQEKLLTYPFQTLKEHNYGGQHHWEINKKGYQLKKIKNMIKKAGLSIEKTYRPFDIPAHRFFVLNI